MPRESIDEENLTVTGAHRHSQPPGIRVEEDVVIVVTQAFGPNGDNLVGVSDVKFDGYPAVTLKVKTADAEGLVHLSPIHGDKRKEGFTEIPPGTRCELFCPVSGDPLPRVGAEASDPEAAGYFALYLTNKLDLGAIVAVSDLWGHYHSRIVDDNELISHWAAAEA